MKNQCDKKSQKTKKSVLYFLKRRDYSKTYYSETQHSEKDHSQLKNLRWELKELHWQMSKNQSLDSQRETEMKIV